MYVVELHFSSKPNSIRHYIKRTPSLPQEYDYKAFLWFKFGGNKHSFMSELQNLRHALNKVEHGTFTEVEGSYLVTDKSEYDTFNSFIIFKAPMPIYTFNCGFAVSFSFLGFPSFIF